jgi:xanthine dehydrogenase accessory factor
MRSVLDELIAARERGLECIYCQVVETRGSTPQKAGAVMLVYADGRQAGTLGGGCIEADVKRRALARLHDQAPPLLCTFTLDGDYGWDDGLICGGRMTILVHPLTAHTDPDSAALSYYRHLHALVQGGQGHWEAVALESTPHWPATSRWLFDHQGSLVAWWGGGAVAAPEVLEHLLANKPASVNTATTAMLRRATVRQGIAWLPTPRRKTLLIVGGGHVGQATAQLAAAADFDIWVLDDRERYASAERFPQAQRRLVGPIGVTLQELAPTLTDDVYAVIVTRGHNHDEEALFHLACTACGYVGMIGSRRKIRLIFEDLQRRGIPAEALQRVRAPLGWPIGSQSVMEIAISIVAELIAWRNLGPEAARRMYAQLYSDPEQGCSLSEDVSCPTAPHHASRKTAPHHS